MDPAALWTMIERLSGWFYDPVVFWAVPFALAAAREILRARRDRQADPRG